MKKILLLEDDTLLAQTLYELLSSEGYTVTLASCGEEVLDLSFEQDFDLYVFDINVPDINGMELLKSLRDAEDRTPTIFISALVDLNSLAKAFEVGGDDYIKKPFFPEELLIRVNAKLEKKAKALHYKNIILDRETRSVTIDGIHRSLGDVQERLLELFLENIGRVLENETLLGCLEKPSSTALRVALTKLKQTTGLQIKNLRGIGYILE